MLTKFFNSTLKFGLLGVMIFLIAGIVMASFWQGNAQAETSCSPVVSGEIYRFIDGLDQCLVPMDAQEIQENLNDPFATQVLRKNEFPDSAQMISDAIANAENADLNQTSYVVGEGGQVPLTVASGDQPRNLRYVITWGANANDAQILLSVAAPASQSGFHQVIGWDEQAKAFNYYELGPQVNGDPSSLVWSWAGNSFRARQPQTMGKGCFDCHHNGVPIMKELKVPWNNWNSQRALISSSVVPVSVANEEFFQQKADAAILEQAIQSDFQKYYQNWLRSRFIQQGNEIQLKDVNTMLSHFITNTTMNLASANIQSRGANTSPPNSDISGVPPIDTFLWDSILQTRLGLNYQSPAITFERDAYNQYLTNHKFRLVQVGRENTKLYHEDGSTYFANFVPQVAAEDTYMTQQLLNAKIVTNKFVASVAMVDFKNPLFSEKRASLQKYANEIHNGTIVSGTSSIPVDFAAKIEAVASPCPNLESFDSCSAEEQFLYLWNLPEDQWQTSMTQQLNNYVAPFKALSSREQLDQFMKLTVHQRDLFASTPLICNLFEFSLLIPETDFGPIPPCQPFSGDISP